MKVLLVNTASDNAFARVGFVVPPLGIAYIAATLRDAGHDATIHDFSVARGPAPDFSQYGLVGISADTSRHSRALAIAKNAHAAGAKVAIGGPHVSFTDEETLSEPSADFVDFILRGEAEESAVALADALESGASLTGIPGLTYRENGRVTRNPDREPPKDLDALPFPARDLLDINRYRNLELGGRRITSIISSRGCPGPCSFCCSPRFNGTRWRARGVEGLMEEIRLVVGRYGFGGVAFLDDNFTLDPKRVIRLCRAIIEEGIDIKWWCFSRVDTVVKNPEMVEAMGRSGCRYVFMGVESPHQGALDRLSKRVSAEMAKKAVKMLKNNKIETLAAYILGLPDETAEMAEETIRFSVRLDTGGAQYTFLTPFPGTGLYAELQNRLLSRNWDLFDCTHPVVRSDYLSPDELSALLFKAYRSFYMRPKRLLISAFSAVRGRGVKIKEVRRLIESFRS